MQIARLRSEAATYAERVAQLMGELAQARHESTDLQMQLELGLRSLQPQAELLEQREQELRSFREQLSRSEAASRSQAAHLSQLEAELVTLAAVKSERDYLQKDCGKLRRELQAAESAARAANQTCDQLRLQLQAQRPTCERSDEAARKDCESADASMAHVLSQSSRNDSAPCVRRRECSAVRGQRGRHREPQLDGTEAGQTASLDASRDGGSRRRRKTYVTPAADALTEPGPADESERLSLHATMVQSTSDAEEPCAGPPHHTGELRTDLLTGWINGLCKGEMTRNELVRAVADYGDQRGLLDCSVHIWSCATAAQRAFWGIASAANVNAWMVKCCAHARPADKVPWLDTREQCALHVALAIASAQVRRAHGLPACGGVRMRACMRGAQRRPPASVSSRCPLCGPLHTSRTRLYAGSERPWWSWRWRGTRRPLRRRTTGAGTCRAVC